MSATNATTYYELPVFIATDKPAWLTDWNGAMTAIDTAIKEALTAGENAQTTANTATSSIATINDSLTTINTSLTTLTSTVTGLTGSVNTINSLIGNGEPTTSDKTLIGAINEIYAMIGGGTEVDADIVAYDNTTSGLTATNVQDAIDELAGSSPSGSGVNLTSGGDATITMASSFSASASDGVKYAFNDDKSLAKFFGAIVATYAGLTLAQNTWTKIATLSFAGVSAFTNELIIMIGATPSYSASNINTYIYYRLHVQTDGTVDVEVNSSNNLSNANGIFTISLPASLYQLSSQYD